MESKFIANGAVPNNGNVDIVADGAARKKLYRNSLTLATLNEFDDFDEEKEDQIDGPKRILAVLVPLTAYINKRPSDQSYAHTEGTMSNGVSITTLEDVGSLTSGQSMKALDYPVSKYSYSSLHKTDYIDKAQSQDEIEYEGVHFTGVPESEDEEEVEAKEKDSKIPDGGWGWMVVLAAFFINMAGDGIAFSFGLLYIEFLNEFGASKSKTAWIGSLFMAVPLLLGPVASTFVEKYGCRNMTIVAGIISGIGFVLSCFSNTIEHMYLTFGILAGIGLALSYVTAVVSIAFWFEKKRGLACSLGSTGTGFGTTVYAPITSYLIYEYGWRGTVLLLSGTFFNLCVCGAIMRDPEWWTLEQTKEKDLKSLKGASSCGSVSNRTDSDMPDIEELKQMLESGVTPNFFETTAATEQNAETCRFSSVLNIPTYFKNNEKLPLEVIDKLSRNHRLYNIIIDSNPKLLTGKTLSNELHYNTIQPDSKVASEIKQSIKQAKQDEEERRIKRKRSSEEEEQAKMESTDLNSPPENQVKPDRPLSADLTLTTITTPKLKHLHKAFSIDCERGTIEHGKPKLVKNYSVESEKGIVEPVASVSKVHHDSRCKSMSPPGNLGRQHRSDSTPWLRRQFSFKEHPTHYLKHLKVHRNSVMYRGAALTTPSYRLRASSCPNIYRNSITTIAKDSETNWMDDARELLATMFDFSMFLELHFFLVSVSTILLFTWFVIPYFYLTDFVTNRGLSKEEATSILSYIGVTNTIGMVVLGWACDQPWLNVKKTYAVCLIGCGLSTVMMPFFATNYYALLVTCLSFGVFFASNFSCTPIILVELVPLDRFATAYGLTLLAQGIGNLVGPPLAGWVFDVTQVWDYSFFLAGFWIVISGVLIAIIPFTENKIIWGSGTLEMDREDLSV